MATTTTTSTAVLMTVEKLTQCYAVMVNNRSERVLQTMDLLAPHKNFRDRRVCYTCGKNMVGTTLRDNLAWREFCISGHCQECQDKIKESYDEQEKLFAAVDEQEQPPVEDTEE
jgi:hypothetical protein